MHRLLMFIFIITFLIVGDPFVTVAVAQTLAAAGGQGGGTIVGQSPIALMWAALWAALGGLVSFHQKVKKGITRWFNISELIGECVTSGFVGLLTYFVCTYAKTDPLLTAVFVGISGHMGARVIFMLEVFGKNFFEKKIGIKLDDMDTTIILPDGPPKT